MKLNKRAKDWQFIKERSYTPDEIRNYFNKNQMKTDKKAEHYSTLKMVLRVVTLLVAVWALVVAYQAKSLAEWVDNKQEKVIERIMFD